MTSMAASTVPKFYKSVIDDVVNNVREIFLDDGVDEQVIQELRQLWERKITESRAIDHATAAANSNTSTTTSNSKSSHSKKSSSASNASSAAGGQTSVITSNPNHVKNGPSSNSNSSSNNSSVRIKEEHHEHLDVDHSHRRQQLPNQQQTPQPLTTSVVQAPAQLATNGTLIQQQPSQPTPNLAQPMAPTTNILRASAIVSNPSGQGPMSAGMNVPTTAPHQLIQVHPQQLSTGNRHGTQQQATSLNPSTTGSNRPTIVTLIPSSSSSFSPVIVSSNHSAPGGAMVTSSSLSTTTNYKANGAGSLGTFTPRIVTPKVAHLMTTEQQKQHQQQQQQSIANSISSNPAMQNRIVTVAPHGHKKRILSSAIADRNALNGSNSGNLGGGNNNNLTSLAQVVAASQQHQQHQPSIAQQQATQAHLLDLARQQQAHAASQQAARSMAHLSATNQARATTAAGLLSAAGLQQQMANNHQLILGSAARAGSNKQEVKYPTIVGGPGGQKVVLLPNNAGQFVMATPQTQFVITPEMLSQMGLQGGILTTGPNGQPTVLHHAPGGLPSAIQYAGARASAPTIQQVRTIGATGLMPGQVIGQPGATNVGPNGANTRVAQLDGLGDSSSDDDDEDDYRDNDDDADDDNDEMNDEENDGGIEDEEPLNSGDDVSDEDPNELFDTDNVVVCQYDKITRSRNKWKFHFKDGIMNLQGKDYVFQKAVGDAEW